MKRETPRGPAPRGRRRPAAARAAAPTIEPGERETRVDVGLLLPTPWLAAGGFTSGAELRCRALPDGSLLIRARPAEGRRDTCYVEVAAETPLEHVFRQLVAAYLAGADEFVLYEPDGQHPATRALARTFVRRTAGPEIVSEDRHRIVLRVAPEAVGRPVPVDLRRMFRLVAGLQETAGAFLSQASPVDPSELSERDDEVDREAWLVERTLGRPAAPSSDGWSRDPASSLLLARSLERIGDHAVTLGTHAARLAECSVPEGVRATLRAYHQQAVEYLRGAFAVAEEPDATRANDLIDLGDALLSAHATLTENLLVRASSGWTPVASASLGLILQSIDRTAAYAQDIAQVGLDRAIATQIALGTLARADPGPNAAGRPPEPIPVPAP